MKKSLLLFLVLTMIFSTLFGMTVLAGEAVSISLYKNTSFITSVDTTKSLIVTGIDADGNDVSLPEGEISYKSSRPWVLDIDDETGKFIDGGYEGTTTVTATIGKMSASIIFIKGSGDGYNTAHLGEADDVASSTYVNDNLRVRRTYNGRATRVDPNDPATPAADKAAARVFDKKYLKLTSDYTPVSPTDMDSGAVLGLDNPKTENAWSKSGLRVVQNWFYDDGSGKVYLRMSFVDAPKYLDNTLKSNLSSDGLSWMGEITAEEGSLDYTQNYGVRVNENTENKIKRSRGWHQATAILNDDATVDVFIDGEKLSTSKGIDKYNETTSQIFIAGYIQGNYDDFIIAKNPNTEKPAGWNMPAKNISLYKNTTFIKNVDTEQKLIVTGIDKNGEDTILPEGDIIYTSSRPWVLDIDAKTGKFIDGGYEGTTTVTATVGGMSASTIFIKGSGDGYNIAHRGEADDLASEEKVNGVLNVRRTYNGRATRVDPNDPATPAADKTAARVSTEKYLKLLADYSGVGPVDFESGVVFAYNSTKSESDSWSKLGLRVVQNWFYDDGESAIHLRMCFIEDAKYLDDSLKQNLGTTQKDHLAWVADITADAGSEEYAQKYVKLVTENTENKIERSRGWHQATAILNDDATVDVFVDGKKLSSSKIADRIGGSITQISVAGYIKGNYDDLVIAKNPNTTKPVTITANAGENGTVSPASIAAYEGNEIEFTVTPDESYIIDKIMYGEADVTAMYKDGKIVVKAKDGSNLSVTFKRNVKLPSVLASEHKGGITYLTIDNGNTGNVKEAGIMFGAEGIGFLRLIGYSSYDNETATGIPVVDGTLGIKVAKVNAITAKTIFTIIPFVAYTNGGETVDAVFAESFTQEFDVAN